MDKLYRVSLSVNIEKGTSLSVDEFDCKETKKLYKLTLEGKYSKTTVHLKKDELMHPFQRVSKSSWVLYTVYCVEEKIEEAKELVTIKAKKDLLYMEKNINKLKEHLKI